MFGAREPADEVILDKIRLGDQRMLLLLYKRNRKAVRSYVRQNSGDEADVEDILQEALVVLWEKAQQPDFTLTAKVDTFVFGVAKNLWLKNLRKNGRIHSHDFGGSESNLEPQDDTPEEEGDDKARVLAGYMSKLGDTCRELLSLFYFEEWDMEQIARKMNFANADTAKAKKYQCKKKLEELIKKQYTANDLL